MFRAGAARYRVRIADGPLVVDGESCVGVCDERTRSITLAHWLAPERRLNVLLHELAHAHIYAGGRPRTDEELCDFVATVAELAFRDLQACGGEAALKRLSRGESLGRSNGLIRLTQSRSCRCGGTIAPGDVLCRHDPERPDQVRLALYCDHCDVTVEWSELMTFGGQPSGVVSGEPKLRRGNRLSDFPRHPADPCPSLQPSEI